MKCAWNVVCSLLVALGFSATSTFAGETLKIRADMWMPYNGDPQSENPGYVVELARMIFEPQGIKIDYQTMPWAEALAAARAGKIGGVIGAGSSELEGLVAPEESIGEPRVVLIASKDSKVEFQSIASLKKLKLGAIEGYTYWDALDGYIAENKDKVVLFNGETPLVDALRQLKDGKIDVMAETMSVFVWTTRGMGMTPSDFRILHSHQNEPIYLAFADNEDGKRHAKIFDEGMRKLRASGELAKLLKRYGLAEWK